MQFGAEAPPVAASTSARVTGIESMNVPIFVKGMNER